ncbi:MAG: AMP-binding protein [Microthrixaceae bacterium]|nr:AMP-binding protein [Microthrixaceae bacterium]
MDLEAAGCEDYETALAGASGERDFGPRSNDDLYILYTGGTTGMPKGVMWRHEDFFKSTIEPIVTVLGDPFEAPAELAERTAKNIAGCGFPVAPLMHGASQWIATGNGLQGTKMVLSTARRMDPLEVWRIVADEKAMVINLVGDAQARPLVEALQANRDRFDLTSLFLVSSGGAILSPAVKQLYGEVLPNVIMYDALGASGDRVPGNPRRCGRPRSPQVHLRGPHHRARRRRQPHHARGRSGGPPDPPGPPAARLLQGRQRRPPRPSPRSTASAGSSPATWPWPRPTAPSPSSAGARCRSTPVARRYSPRRSSWCSRVTPTSSTPSSSACPTNAGVSASRR